MCKIFVPQCLHCVIYFLKAHIYKLLKIRENSPYHILFPCRINQDHKKALCPYLHVFGGKKWPRLVRRGSGSQAQTLATLS